MSAPDGADPSTPLDGADPSPPPDLSPPLDPTEGLTPALRIGTPVHVIAYGNPSGAPCQPGVYLGFDGVAAWTHTYDSAHSRPHTGPTTYRGAVAPPLLMGSFHLAGSCAITGPLDPPWSVHVVDPVDSAIVKYGDTTTFHPHRVQPDPGTAQ